MLKTVKEYLPITGDGLFTAFANPVWAVVLPNAAELDNYFFLRYGDRISNKLLDFYADDGVVSGDKLIALSKMIYSINDKRWEHLFGAYMAEYNPIENTDFIETITDVNINTKVIDTDSTADNTITINGTVTTTGSNSSGTNVYGFNSVAAVGDTEATGSATGSTTTGNTTTSDGANTEDSTITDNGTHTSEHRKHGNIGVTENVQMLRSEVNFWWKWSFVDYICQDICDMIALSIY